MKPKPFSPIPYADDQPYIRDKNSGLVWHSCIMRSLYADTDRSSVVYHANYLRYFEYGRTSLMRSANYPYKQIEAKGYLYPIVNLGINFYEPIYYDDLILIHTRPAEKERVKVRFEYVITHAETGKIVCSGFTRHCAINSNGKVIAVDEGTVLLWETFPK